MISVTIKKKNHKIESILVSGHAGYDVEGKDIVCAGVSSIMIGGVNAIYQEDENAALIVNEKGNVSITMKDTSSDTIQIILRTMITQLKTIEASYKKYVKIINK